MFSSKYDQQFQKILAVHRVLNDHFKNDILISAKNHVFEGYEFPHKSQFVCAKKASQFLKSKNTLEIRFLCGLKPVSKTHNIREFFETSVPKTSPVFLVIPYFYEKLESSHEYLLSYQCTFELKVKVCLVTNKLRYNFHCYTAHDLEELIQRIKRTLSQNKSSNQVCLSSIADKNSSKIQISLPKTQIISAIQKTIEHMKQGDCYLANITHTQSLDSEVEMSAITFLTRWFTQRSAFGFHLIQNDVHLACFSPERFLIKKGRTIATQPIKGTQKKGTQTRSDTQLWRTRKEMYEHTMVVDLLRHDLNSICVPGSVGVENAFYIKRCPSILHMESTVVGALPEHYTLLEIFSKILPAGSITGTPKKRTCEIISQYERGNRGYYTGVAGIVETNHDFDFAVLIRTLFKGRFGVYTGVGAGITTLSNAEKEFQEFYLKLKSFL